MRRLLLLSLLASVRCTSLTSHMTAAPLDPGRTEFGMSSSALVVENGARPRVLPQVTASARHGITKGFDVGIKVSAIGLEMSTRHLLASSGRVALGLVPSVGFEVAPLTSADTEFFLVRVGLAWLLDVMLSEDIVAVFGLRPLVFIGPQAPKFANDPSGVRFILMPGASVGVRLPIGRRWAIFPEVDVHVPWDVSEHRIRIPVVDAGLGVSLRKRF